MVSLAGQANPTNYCGVNKLGILFSTVQYNENDFAPICSNCAQICSDSIVTDTLNWTRITGSFIADSSYLFINLGKFNVKALTDTIQLEGNGFNSYYYIDVVCISTDSAFTNNYIYNNIYHAASHSFTKIFPNPTYDYIKIENSKERIYSLQIKDLIGRLVRNIEVPNANYFTINLYDIPNGIYYITINLLNSKSLTKKIVKL